MNGSFLILLLLITACTKRGLVHEPGELIPGMVTRLPGLIKPVGTLPFEPAGLRSFSVGGEDVLKVVARSDVDSVEARKLIDHRRAQIERLYQLDQDPYFGSSDENNRCDAAREKEIEQEDDDLVRVAFDLSATKQFVVGVCGKSGAYYNSRVVLLYCKKRMKFFEVKFFTKKEVPLKDDLLFSCG